ncbi:GAF domain-containing protein [Bacillus sp. FJAT-42376]|uniref:GAF domain-containing sensor histidine kinase n=1 Tax=Bacillus sp. FJAT-42376 TaxID=2014076 RepID=UPI000F4DFE42|nr:GAF domain-containing sensor histidine kinase [Bacillus sp. FJAT-42376]AZB42024.1 GAF domain-containing protein [Bacillus sp. FJAT-42376]
MNQDQRRMKELGALKVIAEKLNEGSELQKLLPDVLKELVQLIEMKSGWIYLVNEEGEKFLAADYSLPDALLFDDKRVMCGGKSCWCLDRFSDGRLKKAANILSCKRIDEAEEHQYGDTEGMSHHATVPLHAGGERFGLLNVGAPGKSHFSDEELALLESVALQIGSAIKRIQLTEKEQQLALAAERNRLAQDLHDSVSQLLFSISLTAGGMREMTEDEHLKDMLRYMQGLSQDALNEMKALIWQLRPPGLEKGLACALKQYADLLGLDLVLHTEGVHTLPSLLEESLWRIGQEALNNCRKHSGLNLAEMTLSKSSSKVQLVIQDKGRGFKCPEADLPSLGLQGMKRRAEQLNGTFSIRSKPGSGTSIQVTIPLKGAEGS